MKLARTCALLVMALVVGGLVVVPAATAQAAVIPATHVKTTWTGGPNSTWAHPSPDPSGITYNSRTGELIISDGEVEETGSAYPNHVWMGTNLFYASLSGSLLATNRNTLAYSPEPTGVGFRPTRVTSGHTWPERLFVSDDDAHRVFEVNPGGDGIYGNVDDTYTSFDVAFLDLGPEVDAEDVAVDLEVTRNGQLLIIDGLGRRVFVYNPGPDRIFNGRAGEGGDDFVERVFDVSQFGAGDPEGIAYNPFRQTIFVLDDPSNQIFEFGLTGSLLNIITLPFRMGSAAGIALAPPSNGSAGLNVYIVDRGVDNDTNQDTFNDGRLYEVAVPGLTGTTTNTAPTVSAGPDRTITLPGTATLSGSVTDDGLPNPPAATTATWSKLSGPGTVTFSPANAAASTASFSEPGTYVLRLTGSDGALAVSDDVTVTVLAESTGGTAGSIDIPIRASADDAEERGSSIFLSSGDLNLALDSGRAQTVGMRFTGVDVPKGATITNAWVQFQVDEVSSGASDLTIAGQAADSPPAFTTAVGDLSGRPLTAARASWSFPDWPTANARTEAQRTGNLAAVIQEIIDRGGWATGNPVALLVSGTGERTAESYDGGAAKAPVLHVEWTTGSGGTTNAAPTVDAGPDSSVTMPAAATLAGSVTDDGLPNPPAATTAAWTMASGPGTVTFADPAAASTTATFSAAGTYVLRLTGSDGALSDTDEVTVTVADDSPTANAVPTVSAGPDRTITLPGTASLAGTVTDDGLPNPPAATTAAWSTVSGPGTVTFSPVDAAASTASFSEAGTYVLRLTGSDGSLSAFDDVTVTVLAESTGGTAGSIDIPIRASVDDAEERGSRIFLSSGDLNLALDSGRAQTIGMRFTGVDVPKGATITDAWVQFQVDEVSSGVSDLTIAGQAADSPLSFTTTAGDLSGRPLTAARASWSFADWPTANARTEAQRTGNLAAVIQEIIDRGGWATGNPVALLVTGSGERTAESYDGGAAKAPVLHVEWTTGTAGSDSTPANGAPTVDAGAGSSVTMPAAATLSGSVTDDGQPNPPAATTAAWTTTSGPGTVTFADPAAASTTATFSAAGTYVLRLTGSDGSLSAFDEVTVTVASDSPTANTAPTVDAGSGSSVTMPAAATLSGSVTDDGQPNPPAATTAAWTTTSGPGTVTFADPAAESTTATFSAAGTYVLRLTGSDGSLAAFDEVTVTVLAESTGGTAGSIDIPIRASADDAEERGSSIFLSSGDLNLALDSGRAQTIGMRFTGVDVPKGATITAAWVQFQVDEVSSGASDLTIAGQAADSPPAFTTTAGDLVSRPVTAASASWSFADWPTAGARTEAQRTGDLAAVIQEIVDRGGWATGNPVVLLVSGTGERTAESYDGGAARAPVLHIEWTV